MDTKTDTTEPVEEQTLSPEEEKELEEGMAIYEMSQTKGFQIVKEWLNDLAFHSWMDPRQTKSQEEWAWQELNAYYASSNAKELLDRISKAVNEADYLHKIKKGEMQRKSMRF